MESDCAGQQLLGLGHAWSVVDTPRALDSSFSTLSNLLLVSIAVVAFFESLKLRHESSRQNHIAADPTQSGPTLVPALQTAARLLSFCRLEVTVLECSLIISDDHFSEGVDISRMLWID